MPLPVPPRVDTVYVVDTVAAVPMAAADDLRAGRFDNGKMWTFEYPPLEYFAQTYGFEPDSAWFEHARLGALRLPNCTASFVSPNGLVLTNHHCARESVTEVSRPGEELLDDGFYAATLEDERAVEDLYLDQFVAILDVTDEIDAVPDEQREDATEDISERVAQQFADLDSVVVEVISLWNGAKTSAYVFRRFTDVRLVMAPELQLGYYGGDPDNFTYPRYALDMSFYRVYENAVPYQPEYYFAWSTRGVEAGDAVFVIGNPGSTSRLQTVAELEFRRSVGDKATLEFITSRIAVLEGYTRDFPDEAAELDLRNSIFSLLNSQKAYTGIWHGLHDPVILAKRRDNQTRLQSGIMADSALNARYGSLIDQLASIQAQKAEFASPLAAYFGLGNPALDAALVSRGILAFQYLGASAGGAPPSMLSDLRDDFAEVGQQPRDLQRRLLEARLTDMVDHLGMGDPAVRQVLQGRTAARAAQEIVEQSALADSTGAVAALASGTVSNQDPAVQFITAIVPSIGPFQQRFSGLTNDEESLARELGRARYALFGTADPPDATFSLRIADGVVSPYEYNGTVAPVYTTFYGLYDHFHSYGADSDWRLPERWITPPSGFDLSTPMNFVSTADIIGGNSGSPVINSTLELVGVAFDGNIESLPGDYIYLPEKNRAVAVDARGMLEALEDIYGARRLVEELRSGQRARR
jgi:hypothetical protein